MQDGLTDRRRDARFTTSSAVRHDQYRHRKEQHAIRVTELPAAPHQTLTAGISTVVCRICACVPGSPTFFLLLGRRAARGLIAGLLSHRDGRDDAGLAAQTPFLFFLLQVLQDVLGSLVGARHRPCRERFLEGGGMDGWRWIKQHQWVQTYRRFRMRECRN